PSAGGRRGGDADQPAAAAGREGAEPEGVSGAVAERERPEGEGAGEGEEWPDPARAGAARGRRDQADEALLTPQPLSPEGRGEKTATHRLRRAFSASANSAASSLPSPSLSKRFTIPLTSWSLRPGILPNSSASSLPSPSLSCRRITSFASSTKSTW